MKRTAATVFRIWRTKGAFWPVSLARSYLSCLAAGMPRGLIVEPSQDCTGTCGGCARPENPANIDPSVMEQWLDTAPAKPVTIHLSGAHSDPLASPVLGDLVHSASRRCSMLSVSTIGLGMRPELPDLPVDRWLVSLPAATAASWRAVRCDDRLEEAIEAVNSLLRSSRAMVEVVLTLWKPSERDEEAFAEIASKNGWKNIRTVFGRFDPSGHHVGRLENLALGHSRCPYGMDGEGRLHVKSPPGGCPLDGYLFLDATGTLRPCPFTSEGPAGLRTPSKESWRNAGSWRRSKQDRAYDECKWCP